MPQFGFESDTSQVLEGISLPGATVLVTGANSGLGMETARALAAVGAKVVLLGRDMGKLEDARAQVAAELPAACELQLQQLDLADLDSVQQCASQLLEKLQRIDVLINNAGVMATSLQRTAQGFEMQFGTNHLGHFLFTCLLAPALRVGSRVVCLSSGGHKIAPVNLDDPNYQQRDYDKWQAYGESKSANALFAVALNKRLSARGALAFSVHPGMIATNLGRYLEPADYEIMQSNMPEGTEWQFKTIPQGVATSVWAATAPELTEHGGAYLEDCKIAVAAAPGVDGGVESYAIDPELAEQLWQLSEDCVGQRFNI